MAVAFVLRIGDLIPEFLANALIILGPFQAAGAVSTGALETLPNGLDHLLIFVKPNSHDATSFLLYYYK